MHWRIINGRMNCVREFRRMSRGQHNTHSVRVELLEGTGRVGIDNIVIPLMHPVDDTRDFRVGRATGTKRRLVKVFEKIRAGRLQLRHDRPYFFRIAVKLIIQKSLKVGRHLDVHRRREARLHVADPVLARGEKTVKNIVPVRRNFETTNRHPHFSQ